MLIEKITNTHGIPNYEGEIRSFIIDEIKDHVDSYEVDTMGNIIAVKNQDKEGKHIALSAHMDEVGCIVLGIDANGFIRFEPMGIDPRVLVAEQVLVGKDKISGVIGSKPIHLLSQAERDTALTKKELYIDIGAKDKKEAEKHVSPGDPVFFDSQMVEFGEHKVKAKGLDDRVGCAVIIETLKKDLPYKLTALFVVQEEVGLRGSKTAAYQLEADLLLNLEGTVCADFPDVKPHQQVTVSGNGPAISLIDRTSIYQKPYIDSLIKVATDNDIPYQFRKAGSGGTDAGNYHYAKEGMPCIGISVPCRYIHSPVSVMDTRDYEHMISLVEKYIKAYHKEDIIHG